ncbi:hypothetical protein GQR58_030734 [Nymphon striatum]|nr:hypothetical protein GQR58_030734 [Nymphon striatum]
MGSFSQSISSPAITLSQSRSELLEAFDRSIEHAVLLAEREPHQRQAEVTAVVAAHRANVDGREIGALRAEDLEASRLQASVQPISLGLQLGGKVSEVLVAKSKPGGNRRLKRGRIDEGQKLLHRTDRSDQFRPSTRPADLPAR